MGGTVGRSGGHERRWHVYILRCADDSLYTGVARDPERRLAQHNGKRGAAYTRSRRPVRLVYREPAADRSAALRREWAIKQLSRSEKLELIMAKSRPTSASDRFTAIRPAALRFLSGLKRRNTKPWFEANRAVYETEVRAPLKALVEEVDVHLARVAPEIVGDPRRSLFRINRDVRFSRDKSPYKTNAACWFYHQDAGRGVGGEASGGAGFYFHFSPTEIFMGGGIWMPPRPTLGKIRERLAEEVEQFERIVLAPAFRRRFGRLDDEAMLKRMPRGYAEDHPAARWLRYQSFTVGRELSRREFHSPRLPQLLARDFAALTPFVRWLNHAVGFAPMTERV
jgi:uncharacterized protein (TIGR02453 family)